MRILCVIPARGGSKSIPRKNISLLNGRPLIDYSIKYANKCPIINKVIVSTDDREIANIALNCGAEIPFMRPDYIATDATQDYPVIKHALDYFDSIKEYYDIFVLLRPTSPLRPDGLIEKALEIIKQNPSASSVRSVAVATEHPYRMWVKNGKSIQGLLESNELNEPYNLPRQILPEYFFQTGDIEVVTRETLLNGSISGQNVMPLVIENNFIDIDNTQDLMAAEIRLAHEK